MELYNDYKRRRPDEVPASQGRSQQRAHGRVWSIKLGLLRNPNNTLDDLDKATSLSATSVKSVSHGTLISCGVVSHQRAVSSPPAPRIRYTRSTS